MGLRGVRSIASVVQHRHFWAAVLAASVCLLVTGLSGQPKFDDAANLPALAASQIARVDFSPSMPWIAFGRVTDADGKPMADVKVRAAMGHGGATTFTDADGRYEFHFGPGIWFVTDKPYCQAALIKPMKPGFSEHNMSRQGECVAAMSRDLDAPIDMSQLDTWSKPAERVFLPGVPKEIDFVLVPAVRASGRLIDVAGTPLVGYSVSLTGKEMPPGQSVIAHTTTDDEGKFELLDLPEDFAFQFLVEPAQRGPPCARGPVRR